MDIVDSWFVHYQPCLDGCLNFMVTCLSIINEGSVQTSTDVHRKSVLGHNVLGLYRDFYDIKSTLYVVLMEASNLPISTSWRWDTMYGRDAMFYLLIHVKVDPTSNKTFNIFLKCITISEARLFCAPTLYMFTVNLPAQAYFKAPNFCKSFPCNKCRD